MNIADGTCKQGDTVWVLASADGRTLTAVRQRVLGIAPRVGIETRMGHFHPERCFKKKANLMAKFAL